MTDVWNGADSDPLIMSFDADEYMNSILQTESSAALLQLSSTQDPHINSFVDPDSDEMYDDGPEFPYYRFDCGDESVAAVSVDTSKSDNYEKKVCSHAEVYGHLSALRNFNVVEDVTEEEKELFSAYDRKIRFYLSNKNTEKKKTMRTMGHYFGDKVGV